MTDKHEVRWTCDRCGEVEERDPNDQPQLWGRVKVARPPRSAETNQQVDLCQSCLKEIQWALAGESTPEVQAPDAPPTERGEPARLNIDRFPLVDRDDLDILVKACGQGLPSSSYKEWDAVNRITRALRYPSTGPMRPGV